MAKAFSVLAKAMQELGSRGVRDVHDRLAQGIIPEGKEGAEERALELAEQALEALHVRGLEARALELALELGIAPLPPARLAGSTPIVEERPPLEVRIDEGVGAGDVTRVDLGDGLGAQLTDLSKEPDDVVPVKPSAEDLALVESLRASEKAVPSMGVDLGAGPDRSAAELAAAGVNPSGTPGAITDAGADAMASGAEAPAPARDVGAADAPPAS